MLMCMWHNVPKFVFLVTKKIVFVSEFGWVVGWVKIFTMVWVELGWVHGLGRRNDPWTTLKALAKTSSLCFFLYIVLFVMGREPWRILRRIHVTASKGTDSELIQNNLEKLSCGNLHWKIEPLWKNLSLLAKHYHVSSDLMLVSSV